LCSNKRETPWLGFGIPLTKSMRLTLLIMMIAILGADWAIAQTYRDCNYRNWGPLVTNVESIQLNGRLYSASEIVAAYKVEDCKLHDHNNGPPRSHFFKDDFETVYLVFSSTGRNYQLFLEDGSWQITKEDATDYYTTRRKTPSPYLYEITQDDVELLSIIAESHGVDTSASDFTNASDEARVAAFQEASDTIEWFGPWLPNMMISYYDLKSRMSGVFRLIDRAAEPDACPILFLPPCPQ